MSFPYQLTLSRESIKFLKKQEEDIRERITQALTGLTIHPPIGDIKPLKGKKGIMRLRVGSYRILFEIDHNEKLIYTDHR